MNDSTPSASADPLTTVAETLTAKSGGSSDSPGYKTTEFWLHALTVVGIFGTALSTAGLPPKWAAGFAVLSTAAYSISRGLAKMGNSN